MTDRRGLVRLESPEAARVHCAEARGEGRTLGFVPTMGALHEGHLSLVRRAVGENDLAVVSVFVNPLQFEDPQDLERYPRDLDGDVRLLESAGCGMVFTGTLRQFFPEHADAESIPRRDPGPDAEGLEGEHRPGHLEGVATIVHRLFELVRPDRAYFGEKDFQQTLVVSHVARELGYPEVVVCPTSREADGLARSSRNVRLSPGARERATALSRALFSARDAWRAGERDVETLRARMRAQLDRPELELEYAEVRDPRRFACRTARRLDWARALVAARVDGVRLIDNLALDGEGEA